AHRFHAFNHGSRWCSTRYHGVNLMLDAGFHLGRCIVRYVQYNWCATEMRRFVIVDRTVNGSGAHVTQGYAHASRGGQGPGETPSVAMKLRQNPQVYRVLAHVPGHDVVHRIQVGATMVVDHAFRVAGSAGGVVQGDGVPFVIRQLPVKIGAGLFQQLFVSLAAQQFAVLVVLVINADHDGFNSHHLQGFFGNFTKLAVNKQHFGFGVLQNKSNSFGIQTGIDSIQHATAHRHTEMRFKHGRNVRTQEGNGFAFLNAQLIQCRGQFYTALIGFTPGVLSILVDLRDTVRINERAALNVADG